MVLEGTGFIAPAEPIVFYWVIDGFGWHWNDRTSETYGFPIGLLMVLEGAASIAPPEPMVFL